MRIRQGKQRGWGWGSISKTLQVSFGSGDTRKVGFVLLCFAMCKRRKKEGKNGLRDNSDKTKILDEGRNGENE